MHHSIRTLSLLLAVMGLLVVASTFVLFQERIQIPSVEPVVAPLSEIERAFPNRASQAVITIRVPLETLQALADRAIPADIQGEFNVPDRNGLGGIRVSPQLKREPLVLRPKTDAGPAGVTATTRIHGMVGVSAFRWLGVGSLKTKSPRFSESADVDADVHGEITPGLDAQWRLTHSAQIRVDVKEAEVRLLGLIPVDMKKEAQAAVDGELPGVMNKALDTIADMLPIRAEVEKVWQAMFRPITVGALVDAQVFLAPTAVRLESLAFDEANRLTVRAAVDGTIQTVVAGEAQPTPQPTPLPDLVHAPPLDAKFRLLLPVGIELSRVNDLLNRDVGERVVELPDATVTIRRLGLYAKGGRLFVKLDIEADSPKLSKQATGAIFLRCDPIFDAASGQLRMANVAFTAETASALQNFALWALNDEICRRVERDVKINVDARLNQLRDDLNTRYAAVELAPRVKLLPHFESFTFDGVRLADNLLLVGFEVSGELSCELDLTTVASQSQSKPRPIK